MPDPLITPAAPAPASGAVPTNPAAPAAPAAAAPAPPSPGGFNDNRGPEGALHPGSFDAPPAAPAATIAAPVVPPEGLALNPGNPVEPNTPPAAPAAPAPARNAREIAAALGFGAATSFQDDQTFVQTVLQHANQSEVYRQQALSAQQQLLALTGGQHQPAGPAAPPGHAPAAPAQPQKFFNAPEYNAAWEGLVTKDAAGNVGLVPGAPPDILPKYLAYHGYRKAFAEKLISDPEGTLSPLIAAQAEAKAREMVDQAMAKRENEGYVRQFMQQNSDWLHARDAQNNVVMSAQGTPVLSPAGQRFHAHVQQAEQMGLRDPRQVENYARQMLRADILASQQTTQQQQQQTQAQVTAANRRPNAAGTLPQPGVPAYVSTPGMSLGDLLMRDLKANGITDEAINVGLG